MPESESETTDVEDEPVSEDEDTETNSEPMSEDYEKAIALITANELPFEKMITDVQPLSNIQQVFESIDKNPSGLKVLMDCQI